MLLKRKKNPFPLGRILLLLFGYKALVMHCYPEPFLEYAMLSNPGLAQREWKGIAFANVSLPHPSPLIQTIRIRGSAIGVIYFSLMLL